VISDYWVGIDSFFEPGKEILLPQSSEEVIGILESTSEDERRAIGEAMRARVLAEHTSNRRAEELERYLLAPPTAQLESFTSATGRNVI